VYPKRIGNNLVDESVQGYGCNFGICSQKEHEASSNARSDEDPLVGRVFPLVESEISL
jgi:hypothetical protein